MTEPVPFEIERIDADGRRTLRLSGEIDISNIEQLTAALADSEHLHELVIDTGQVSFIDSSGLRVLLTTLETLGSGRLILVPSEATQRLLRLTGTAELFGLDGPGH